MPQLANLHVLSQHWDTNCSNSWAGRGHMYTDVCQKPTKFCKAIIWQFKNKLLKK